MKFKLSISGAADIGSVIDQVTVDGDPAFLADADLAECFQQTMLSIELPPLAGGDHFVSTAVTMEFSPAPDAAQRDDRGAP